MSAGWDASRVNEIVSTKTAAANGSLLTAKSPSDAVYQTEPRALRPKETPT